MNVAEVFANLQAPLVAHNGAYGIKHNEDYIAIYDPVEDKAKIYFDGIHMITFMVRPETGLVHRVMERPAGQQWRLVRKVTNQAFPRDLSVGIASY